MSIISSRSPQTTFLMNSPVMESNFHKSDEKPIMKLMRQNNSYLVNQQQLSQQQNQQSQQSFRRKQSNISPQDQLKMLKQFQRSLQKQRPSEISIISHSSIRKSSQQSPYNSPRNIAHQKLVTSFILNESTFQKEEEDQTAFQHRVTQTQKYGVSNLEKIKNLIVDEKPPKSPKSPRKKKPELYSYTGTSSIDKLHKSYQKISSQRRDEYVKKFYHEQMKQVKPFKVQNPISQFILDQRSQQIGKQKPFHERAIIEAREKSLAKLEKQLQKEENQRKMEEQQFRKYEEMRRQKHPQAGNKQRQEQFYYELAQKQKLKNQLKQQQKIMNLKEITKQKPYVTKASKQLFNKIVERQELPKDFVQRNYELKAYRELEKAKQMEKHDQEYCPFAPKISESSRQMAKKYYQRKEKQLRDQVNLSTKQVVKKDDVERRIKQLQQQIRQTNREFTFHDKHTALNSNHRRTTSAHPLEKSIPTTKSKSRLVESGRNNVQQRINIHPPRERVEPEIRDEQIPVYNRIDYGKKRTNSCFNFNCKSGG